MFLQGSGTVTFNPSTGQTQTVSNVIADEAGNGGSAANKWTLSKTGAGTLILGGANSYTGGTTVGAGTVQLGAGGSLASTGALTVNGGTFDLNSHTQTVGQFSGTGGTVDLGSGALTVTQGTSASYDGVITGGGSLTKNGAGTLTLTGANDYSGGTTVSLGTLAGTTTSLQGDIHDNANVTFNQSTPGTYSDTISGSSLTKSGSGTVTLLGSNTYDGGTIVNGGTLAGTTVTLQGDILDNANVSFDQSTPGTYSDTISGSGSVTKAGSGTVTLLGDNTYGGGTIITGGSLHGTTVTLQGDIHINASNANVTFDQAVNGSYTDNITGSGSLTKTGGGTLTLLGDNGYTGGTTVSGGTLAGTTVSLDGNISITAGAHVILDQSAPGTFVGEITGGGDLTKDGTGTVTLSGTNDYSGGTAVDAGILQGTTSSLQGNIFAAGGADVTFAQAANGSYTGQLSGNGSLTKTGVGILTLTGASSYQGGTDVTAGGLSISADDNLGSGGTVTLAANTSLAFTAGGTYTHAITVEGDPTFIVGPGLTVTQSGAIADGGGTPGVVEVSGGGTLALTDAANSYSGGTSVVDGSTLSIADDRALGASTGDLTLGDATTSGTLAVTTTLSSTRDVTLEAGGGTIDTSPGAAATLGGILTGDGELTKVDSGTLLLTGANDYSGGTNIFGGVLQGTTTSLQGDITDNASLVFNQSANGSYDGAIQGAGSLTKLGTGTVTLAGGNSYTGGTLVGAGTLQGTTQSLQGDITDNANVTFDQSSSGDYGGHLSGSGSVTKSGAGTVVFTASNDYSGGTTIGAGILQLGGGGNQASIVGAVVANDSGELSVVNADTSAITAITANDSAAVRFLGTSSAGSADIVTNNSATTTFADSSTAGTASITTNDSAFTFFQDDSTAANATLTTNDKATVQFLQASTAGTATIVNNKGGLTFFNTSSADHALITNENGGSTAFANTSTAGSAIISSSNNGGVTFFDDSTAGSAHLTTNNGGDVEFQNGSTAGSASIATNSGASTTFLDSSSAGTATLTTSGGTTTFCDSSSAATATVITNNGGKTKFTCSSSGGEARLITNAGGAVFFGGLTTAGTTAGSIEGAGSYRLADKELTVGSNNLSTEVSGVISGSDGSLVKVGTGTLTLSGADTYGGGTTVDAGILQLGTGGSLASSGPLTVNGIFDLNGHDQTVGALSGTGGTITLGSGTLTVKQSITTSFLGDISGSGGLTKGGPGTLILDGINDYTGATAVNNGILEIGDADHPDASLLGPVTVGASGKLAGHGTIGGDVANLAGGVVAPGGSTGTLTLGGDYSQGSMSQLLIEVSPTAASQLKVLGNARLDGNLGLVYEPGVYSQASYDIVNAASITGTFDTVQGRAPAGFTQSVTYSPTDVTLNLESGGPIIVAPTNDTIFTALSTAALLAAQQANGALLTHMGELHLGTGSPKVQTALAATAPTQVAFAGTADQLADLLPEIPQAVGQMGGWFKAIGSFASLDGSITTPDFDTQAGGFLAGFDKAVSANFTVGVAAGYLHTNLSEAGGASGSLDTPRLAVYGTYTLGNLAVDATAGYAYDFIDSSRPFANLGQTASSSYNGQEANAALQVSTRANFAGITFMPAAGLAFVHVAQNGVSESGAPGFNLNVNGNSANSLRPFVALTAAKSYTTDGGTVITPEADIAYSYETLATTPPSLVQVGGGSFTVPGLMPSRSQLIIGGGVTAQLTDTLAFEAAYHITPPTGNLLSQTISLGLDYRF
jgi:fibronectin-binding autotransporter adhesin